jgi:hypothetical protein
VYNEFEQEELLLGYVSVWSPLTYPVSSCFSTFHPFSPDSSILEALHHDPPVQIIEDLQTLELQIQAGLDELLAMVKSVDHV